MAVTKSQLVSCMHNALVSDSGGLAMVHWMPDVAAVELDAVAATIQASAHNDDTLVCVTTESGEYIAESYSPTGKPIQFCGHGALAAAWVVMNEHAPDESVVSFSSHRHKWTARRADFDVADVALTYARPEPLECPVPDFAEACLGGKVIKAAKVGADTDYLILELADAAAVKSARPDAAAICAATQRALIITARAQELSSGCVFRYFAPQYGDPEDAATGSAAVQLAAYWGPDLKMPRFKAQQLSLQGATMQLTCQSEMVELAARVGYG
jgi:predicted PhzF superfamily epimerase YddE/YHI9